MALVPHLSREAPIIYKAAVNGRDFIQRRSVERYLGDIEKYSVAIGHNRAATTGRGNIVDHNAHPFQYGKITLVHNGHIRNTYNLAGAVAGSQCQVDSAHVAFSMDANGEMETLEQVEGGFVFVWWNSETETLNIARNNERPLHMAYADKENTFYWASELTELLHLLQNVEIDEEQGIQFPETHTWYKYNLKDLRKFEKVPFSRSQGRRSHNQDGNGASSGTEDYMSEWTEEQIEQFEACFAKKDAETAKTISERKPTTRTRGTSTSKISDQEEVDEIRDTISEERSRDAKKSGIPTSVKNIEKASRDLGKIGINFKAIKNCTPESWTKYKNQHDLGSVLARTKNEGYMVEVIGIKSAQFHEYHASGNLLVECVNVRSGRKGSFRIVGIVSPKMDGYVRLRQRNIADRLADEAALTVKGPNGSLISKAKFYELTDKGCGNCSRDIFIVDAPDVIWVGNDSRPICLECSTTPGVMDLIGFPLH